MKIKIISGKGKWYEKLIGKTVTAKFISAEPFNCYVLRNYRTLLRTVKLEDAELISE